MVAYIALSQNAVVAQTAWTIADVLENGQGNTLARVAYSNGDFHVAWQDANDWNASVYYDVIGEATSPSLPFQFQVNNSTMRGDPDFGSVKYLKIRYATNEGEFEGSIREGDSLAIPDDSHIVVGPPLLEDTVVIIYARYETANASQDVSSVIESALVSSPNSSFDIRDFRFSNLAFESDGTPMFIGSDPWGDRPRYAYDAFDQEDFPTLDFNNWNGHGNAKATQIIHAGGIYVASFSGTDDWSHDPLPHSLASSADLQNWTYASLPQGYSVEGMAYDDGRFIAVGSFSDPNDWSGAQNGAIFTSVTGQTWTVTTLPIQESLQDVIFTGSEWLAVGGDTSFWRSSDGFSWGKVTPINLHGDLTAVAIGNGYVVVGTASGALFSTVDGMTFSKQAQYSGRVNDIAVGNEKFMVTIGAYLLEAPFAAEGVADITAQPASSYVIPSERVTLTVAAQGDSPLSYQWFEGSSGDTSVLISGATSPVFQTPPLSQTERYWVRVQNSVGAEDSLTATLTMQEEPIITDQPAGESLNMRDSVSSRVSATGNNLSYQWYEGFAGDATRPISGRTGSYFGLRADFPGAYYYWVRVFNELGSVDSGTILVTVVPVPPIITDDPQDVTITVNGFFGGGIFVQAVGPSLSYQWYEGFSGDTTTPLASATSWAFYPSDDNAGISNFWVRVTNPAGLVDSRTVTYTVLPMPPVIKEQPLDSWASEGSNVTLRVDVDYRSGTTYQWYQGSSGDIANPVGSATSSSLYVGDLQAGNFTYWVRVTNPDGYTDSSDTTVHVRPVTFSSWLAREGLPINESGDGAPDYSVTQDGFSNLIRFVMGANSHEHLSNTDAFSHETLAIGDNVFVALQFTALKETTDATLHIEESTDLTTWSETAVQVNALDNGDETVTYVYRSSGLVTTKQGFLRLRASRP